MNGHYSVKDSDLHKKQPHKCESHCACPHYNIWNEHHTEDEAKHLSQCCCFLDEKY